MNIFQVTLSRSQILAVHRVLCESMDDLPQEWWADKDEYEDVDDFKKELESIVESL